VTPSDPVLFPRITALAADLVGPSRPDAAAGPQAEFCVGAQSRWQAPGHRGPQSDRETKHRTTADATGLPSATRQQQRAGAKLPKSDATTRPGEGLMGSLQEREP
jgi:hypothetical protein